MTWTPKWLVLEVKLFARWPIANCNLFLGISRGSRHLEGAHQEVQPVSGLVPLWCGGIPANFPPNWAFRVMTCDHQLLRSRGKLAREPWENTEGTGSLEAVTAELLSFSRRGFLSLRRRMLEQARLGTSQS